MKRLLFLILFLSQTALAVDLGLVSVTDTINIPVVCLDTLGRKATPDSAHAFVWYHGEGANDYTYSATNGGAGASGDWLDSISVYGGTVYHFIDVVGDIDSNRADGLYSGSVNLWSQGQPTYNPFSFTKGTLKASVFDIGGLFADSIRVENANGHAVEFKTTSSGKDGLRIIGDSTSEFGDGLYVEGYDGIHITKSSQGRGLYTEDAFIGGLFSDSVRVVNVYGGDAVRFETAYGGGDALELVGDTVGSAQGCGLHAVGFDAFYLQPENSNRYSIHACGQACICGQFAVTQGITGHIDSVLNIADTRVIDSLQAVLDTLQNQDNWIALQTEIANLNGWNPTSDSILIKNPNAYKADVSNLDVAVSSRAVGGDAMTLTASERASIADSVWKENLLNHKGNTAGHALLSQCQYMGWVTQQIDQSHFKIGGTMTTYGNDFFNNLQLVFTDGNLLGRASRIVDWNQSDSTISVDAFFAQPTVNDTFAVVPNQTVGVSSISGFERAALADSVRSEMWDYTSGGNRFAKFLEVDSVHASVGRYSDTTITAKLGAYSGQSGQANNVKDDLLALTLMGGGSEQETLFVFDADTTALEGVKITIRNLSGSAVKVPGRYTDSSGKLTVELDPDSFVVALYANNYIQEDLDTIVVTQGGGTDSLWMIAFDPGNPSSPELCRIYGWVYDISGNAVANAIVAASIPAEYQPIKYSGIVITPFKKSTQTDSTGYWQIDLFPNSKLSDISSKYEFTIEYPSGVVLRSRVSVPDLTSWQLP